MSSIVSNVTHQDLDRLAAQLREEMTLRIDSRSDMLATKVDAVLREIQDVKHNVRDLSDRITATDGRIVVTDNRLTRMEVNNQWFKWIVGLGFVLVNTLITVFKFFV